MALDPEERKIAALFAAFEEINGRVDKAVSRFERAMGGVDVAVRQSVREAAVQELAGLSDHVTKAKVSVENLHQSANWRQLLHGAGWSLVAVLLAFFASWLYLPSPAEMGRLRAEERQLQASVDQLGSRGGRSQVMPCGASNEHLWLRVSPALGRFGDSQDYFVVRGY
jgi:hypothetical protein